MKIILIGFMGTGKSSLGRKLAAQLDYEFLDTDDLIEAEQGYCIAQIFERDGEATFRRLEADLAVKLAVMDRKVIATGGGFPLNPQNMALLRPNSFIVSLRSSPEEIYRRVCHEKQRPLLQVADPLERIKRLLAARAESYEAADFRLNTDGADLDSLCRQVIDAWRKEQRGDGKSHVEISTAESGI